jgi:DNA ligase-1
LADLDKCINELRQTTSLNSKLEILGRHTAVHSFLRLLYGAGPLNLTSASLSKITNLNSCVLDYEYVEDLLGDLETRKISGHQAIATYRRFIRKHQEYEEILHCILDKDFRIRLGPKSILSVVNYDLQNDCANAQSYSFALAKSLDEEQVGAYFTQSLTEKGETWFGSRKLDGIRCAAIIDPAKEKVSLLSRQGKDLSKLPLGSKLLDELKQQNYLGLSTPFVLDGEICCFEEGKDNFSKANSIVMKIVRNSEDVGVDVDALSFNVFDLLSMDEFAGKADTRPFKERLALLEQSKFDSEQFALVKQERVRSPSDLNQLRDRAKTHGWEGVMLRRADSLYAGKRTKDLIKCKQFLDAEFRIVGYTCNAMRIVEGGREQEERLLASIDIEYKGGVVSVGSGFSLEERRRLLREGDRLIGQQATICYFQESVSKTSERPSLRFPIFKSLYNPI